MKVMLAVLLALGAGQLPQTTTGTAPPPPTGVIRGRVQLPNGHPMAGAYVMLRRVGAAAPRGIETDEDGTFEFDHVEAGSYVVETMRFGYGTRSVEVTLAPGEVREHVDLIIPRPGAIAGRIIDEAGDPVEGAIVRVHQVRYTGGRRELAEVGIAAQRSNDLGRYRVWGLQAGEYFVSAAVGQVDPGLRASDLPGYATTYFPGTPVPGEAQPVAVRISQDVNNVDFALVPTPTARVSGIATMSNGDPITGGLALRPSHRSTRSARTMGARIEQDGSFEFPNVPPGEYVVQAFRPKPNAHTEGEFAAVPVTVTGADVTGLAIRTSAGSSISGRLTFDTPPAFRPRDVELEPTPADWDLAPREGGSPARAEIADDWTFQLDGISGPRRLRVTRMPAGWGLKAIYANGADLTDAVVTFGSKDRSLRDVEVQLTSAITDLTASVADARGGPAVGSNVIVFTVDRERWYEDSRFLRRSVVREDGTVRMRALPPGEYFVVAVASMSDSDLAGGWRDPAVLEALSRSATRVVLTEGQRIAVSPKLVTESTRH